MEGFTRELRRHIQQYDAIQGSKWKKITNHIIKQYQKIDSPPFNTRFNMIVVQDPSTTDTKYKWLCILLEWTNSTRHDLITRNLWPKPEITTNQELNTMPMHDNQWGTDVNSWKSHGTTTKSKTWADSSTKLTTPRSISTAATTDFYACFHKSEYRRTQANRQHLDRYFTRIFTHLLVLKMQQLVKPS
jgi:hypothetical protein